MLPAKFKNYDSEERGTLCLLYADNGDGQYLGMVFKSDQGWRWEADVEGFDGSGCEVTRRAAKGALRRALGLR